MLFCVISVLPRAGSGIIKAMKDLGFKVLDYSEDLEQDIIKQKLWGEDLVVKLPSPKKWNEFSRRPFSVLLHVIVCNLSESDIKSQGFIGDYNRFQHELMEIRSTPDLSRNNYIEVPEGVQGKQLEEAIQYPRKFRPDWDAYFMDIAIQTSSRSNCMKRRVGAAIVKNRRIVSLGYNGTSTGALNCHEGGCLRCNANTRRGESLDACFCIHAEESALLHCDASTCEGAKIYTTVFPCRLCSRKILQMKISAVYYLYNYNNDQEVIKMFKDNNVELIDLGWGVVGRVRDVG